MNKNILVLGDGILGKEIVKQLDCPYLSRKSNNFDISNIDFHLNNFINNYDFEIDTIINCIAYTNTFDLNKEKHWDVNYVFVHNLINYCNVNNIKLVHISTDYIYANSIENATENDVPVHYANWYAYTKLLSDGLVQLSSYNYLICRSTHKSNPFPYENGWVDQIGNFDYVDIITKLIINSIKNNLYGIYNLGTETKSMYELALRTNPNVGKINSPLLTPKNVTMDLSKYNNATK
jgi:dTDP-4-dehydrorhamnose reductase